MECNQVEADFNIGQPGTSYTGYLIMVQPNASSGFISNDAYPPSIVDPLNTQIYTTLVPISYLNVNLPPGTYTAYVCVEQQQIAAGHSSVLYDIYTIEGTVETQKLCAKRIITTSKTTDDDFKVLHMMTKKFTLASSGRVELRFGTQDTYGDVKCNSATLTVIKHNF